MIGIEVLYPANEEDLDANSKLEVDIIAVHGLNGNSLKTWTKSKKLWLRDFLPTDLPWARVMTFGYNALAAFSNSVADIEDHARDLLRCLAEKREDGSSRKRPLIIVGHSLGGLVIKQALVIANREAPFKPIFESTHAVIFFGTPHRGSPYADFGATLARVPCAFARHPSPTLLTSLKTGGERLELLTKEFILLLNHGRIQVYNFYETRAMLALRKMIVPKESALLNPNGKNTTWEKQFPVAATHRSICRFSSSKNDTYKTFVRCIKQIMRVGDGIVIENEFFEVPISVSNFTGRDDIRKLLKKGLIADRHESQSVQQRFVLYGLGGSGKTQVCLKFAYENRDRFWGIFWIDATSAETANESFLAIARKCEHTEDVTSIKAWLSGKDNWLLLIDNADDPNLDFSALFPMGSRGAIIITTRNVECKLLATAGSHRVDAMSPDDAVTLLFRTALVQGTPSDDAKQSAMEIVKVLGYLALAIIQAGAVIRQKLCNLNGFCKLYSQQAKELLESGRPPPDSDYQHSVYTTWEISIKMITESSNKHKALALELLQIFSFMHFDGITEDVFENATTRALSWSMKRRFFSQTVMYQTMQSGWDQLAFSKATNILAEFSLITLDNSGRISVHPLVHEWSRARLSISEQKIAWEKTISTMLISSTRTPCGGGRPYERKLLPHINAFLTFPKSRENLFVEGPDATERLYIAHYLSLIYNENDRNQEALDLQIEILDMQKKFPPEGDLTITITESHIAMNLSCLCRFDEAAALWLKIWDERRQKTGESSVATQNALQGLASIWMELSYWHCIPAADMLRKALDTYEQAFGPAHKCTLVSKAHLANCLLRMGRPREAMRLQKEGLEICKKTFVEPRFMSVIFVEGLASSYIAQGRRAKARKVLRESITAIEMVHGARHPFTLDAIRRSEKLPGWFERRKRVMGNKEILDEMRETFGDFHINTLNKASVLVKSYSAYGALENARDLQEEVLNGLTVIYGANHPKTLLAQYELEHFQKVVSLRTACFWWLPRMPNI